MSKKSKKTSSVANTLKVLKNHCLIRAHRGISSCRADDARTLPSGNVLLPFDIYILSHSLTFVKWSNSDLDICTNVKAKNCAHYTILVLLIIAAIPICLTRTSTFNILITKDYSQNRNNRSYYKDNYRHKIITFCYAVTEKRGGYHRRNTSECGYEKICYGRNRCYRCYVG